MNNSGTHLNTIVRNLINPILCLAALFGLGLISEAQTPTATPGTPTISGVIGEVKDIDATNKQMIVRAENGVLSTVMLSEKTQYKRLPLGEKSLTKAADITLTDVGQGDRVWARWRPGADQATTPAAQLVVMSKADLAKKQEQERAEWRRRGVNGIVSSVNPSTREITVTSRSLRGEAQNVVIPITDKVMMRRYPPDTVPKYSEAKPSKFEEVKVNDQLRALGDKTPDGTHLNAEEVVFGTFKIAGGTVTAIDAANNQIKITELQTKKALTINFKSDSVIRRLPEGAMMFGGGGPGGGAPGGARPQGEGPPAAQAGGGAGQKPQGAGGGPRPGGGGSMADLLERLPTVSISELKVGEMVLMSSLPGADPTQLTAIQLVGGVEPLLTMMAARQQQGGGQARPQNVDLNGSFGGMFSGVGVP